MDRKGVFGPCKCVYRTIFRACYSRFRTCAQKDKAACRTRLEANPNGGRRTTWGRKNEEYCADFYLVSRRALSEAEWKLFSYHFLLGADVSLCARRLRLERGVAYFQIYRIMEKLGRLYADLKPYSLYPIDEYFNGRTDVDWVPTREPAREERISLQRERWSSLSQLLDLPVRSAA
jgi:hypothetical protein